MNNKSIRKIKSTGKTSQISTIPLNTSKTFKFESYNLNPTENMLSKVSEVSTPVLGIFSGIFAESSISRNNRYYSKDFWTQVINSDLVKEYLSSGKMIGIFEHPEIDDIYDEMGHPTATHPMNGAFIVKDLKMKGDQVWGEAYLLNTPLGRLLATYFLARDKNGNPLVQLSVSARGKTINTVIDQNGVEVMDPNDYYLPAFDVVLDPGFVNAKVAITNVSESVNRKSISRGTNDNQNINEYKKLESAVKEVKDYFELRNSIIYELNLSTLFN